MHQPSYFDNILFLTENQPHILYDTLYRDLPICDHLKSGDDIVDFIKSILKTCSHDEKYIHIGSMTLQYILEEKINDSIVPFIDIIDTEIIFMCKKMYERTFMYMYNNSSEYLNRMKQLSNYALFISDFSERILKDSTSRSIKIQNLMNKILHYIFDFLGIILHNSQFCGGLIRKAKYIYKIFSKTYPNVMESYRVSIETITKMEEDQENVHILNDEEAECFDQFLKDMETNK
ncbi:hypothetical protein A3Q56_03582 [Intoshia linei]|uniref:Uncharacterized protein n=1 Tax=Intoshia linei TaxID=1819745 RepID=A0A177B302_9BILA|nr:hypothetical protein A3Q56_03582 [Intoshia linei]